MKRFKIDFKNDFLKGLAVAVFTAISAPFVIWANEAGAAFNAGGFAAQLPPFPPFNLQICLFVSISAGIGYIVKQFFSDSTPKK